MRVIINGYYVGTVETAEKIPPPAERFSGDTKRKILDGLIPITTYKAGQWSSYEWFVRVNDASKPLVSSCVSLSGKNCRSIEEALAGLDAEQRAGNSGSIIMWIDHAYLHDVAHVGCSDPTATAACHPTEWYKQGCTGCERVAAIYKQKKQKQDKQYRNRPRYFKNTEVDEPATRRISIFGP
jgi:hypothetical protein